MGYNHDFLYSSVYSSHLFLISSASVRSKPFLSFIVPIIAWNVPLISLIFLKRSLVFSILVFSSVCLHWSLMKAFLSLLAIPWNSAFKWVYLSFSPLPVASVLFSAIYKPSSDDHFAFLHFDCMDHNKLWKILKEMGIANYLTSLLRNLNVGQEATVGLDMKHTGLRQYNHYIWHHTLHVCVCVITLTVSMIKHTLYDIT